MLKDINPGAGSGHASPVVDANGTLFFFVGARTNMVELWKSDGTMAGITLVKNGNPVGFEALIGLGSVNGLVLFWGYDGVHGYELWKSDGTAAGTALVKDIFPGADGAAPNYLFFNRGIMVSMSGTLFFPLMTV